MVFKESDIRTPRERVEDSLLGRLMAEESMGANDFGRQNSSRGGSSWGSRQSCGCGGSRNDSRDNRGSRDTWDTRDRRDDREGREKRDNWSCRDRHDDDRDIAGQRSRMIDCTGDMGRMTWGLRDFPLGSVYAPLQEWRGLYDLETAYTRGTLFRELDLPFTASGSGGSGCSGKGGCRG